MRGQVNKYYLSNYDMLSPIFDVIRNREKKFAFKKFKF